MSRHFKPELVSKQTYLEFCEKFKLPPDRIVGFAVYGNETYLFRYENGEFTASEIEPDDIGDYYAQ